MKLYFMTENAVAYFKGNVSENRNYYLEKDNSWIFEKYKQSSPLVEFKFEVPNFKMDMSSDKPESTDYANVKNLYDGLRNISDTQAADERFWTGLSHGNMWEYMKYRCKLNEDNISSGKILTNYFFNYGHKRSLIVHPLARLWWVGRLIYDEKSSNPYRALEYMKSDFGTKVLSLFSSNFTNNPKITRAILSSANELTESGENFTRQDYLEMIRYVNILAGIIIVDYLSEDELKDKIITHYNTKKQKNSK